MTDTLQRPPSTPDDWIDWLSTYMPADSTIHEAQRLVVQLLSKPKPVKAHLSFDGRKVELGDHAWYADWPTDSQLRDAVSRVLHTHPRVFGHRGRYRILPNAKDTADSADTTPFCACGRRVSACDGSRAGCRKP